MDCYIFTKYGVNLFYIFSQAELKTACVIKRIYGDLLTTALSLWKDPYTCWLKNVWGRWYMIHNYARTVLQVSCHTDCTFACERVSVIKSVYGNPIFRCTSTHHRLVHLTKYTHTGLIIVWKQFLCHYTMKIIHLDCGIICPTKSGPRLRLTFSNPYWRHIFFHSTCSYNIVLHHEHSCEMAQYKSNDWLMSHFYFIFFQFQASVYLIYSEPYHSSFHLSGPDTAQRPHSGIYRAYILYWYYTWTRS